jgi:predicted lipid-binding transport protein (Tim44 family)
LQMTTQPLVEHVTVFDPRSRPGDVDNNIGNDARIRPNGLLLWGMMLMFIGIAVGGTGKMLVHEDIVTLVGVLLSVAGMFLLAYSALSPSRPKRYNSSPAARPKVLTETQTPKSLSQGSNTDYVPSITERTTDLLESPAATTPAHKHDEE